MRVVLPHEDEGIGKAIVEVRSVMGDLPMVRRLTPQAALTTWRRCRQGGWTRCHPQW